MIKGYTEQELTLTGPAAQTGTAARPVALFVLGVPRSGTSALTRVLSLCGGRLPAGLVGASAGNPLGHWEPRTSLRLNEKILHRHDSAWYDPSLRLQEEGAFDAEAKAACLAKIEAFLARLPATPLVVIKDLQITMLSEMWFEAARQAGFDIAAVIAVRHPNEVMASLAALEALKGASPQLSGALWLKFNLLAERHTRGLPRVFVDYANLLDDWRREIKRISAALEINLDTPDEDAVEEFLSRDLHRQQHSGPVIEPFGTDWLSTVYEQVAAAARDNRWDGSALDRVFEAYQASEYGFRTAFKDFRDRFDSLLTRLFRPFNWKLLEIIAMAHRRRGTWA
jgi:hypothetical protein